MQVSKRIYSICGHLKGRKLADIGTDHCHLPIFAINSGKTDYAIGVDVKERPLKSARDNVALSGLTEKIELRLGDGFSPIEPGEVDSAVISGMGGVLISAIIEKGLAKALELKELILSPQSDFSLLRKNLHRLGFEIFNEDIIKDGGKFYPLIMARSGKDSEYGGFDYDFGKIMLNRPTDDFYEYLEELWKRNENIRINNPLTEDKKAVILERNRFIRDFCKKPNMSEEGG